jgi:hypothetical protein
MMVDTVLLVQTVSINQSNAMFSVSPAWINAKSSVDGCPILSDSRRLRDVVILQGERPPTLTRWGAKKDVFVMKPGLPPAPQTQAEMLYEVQVHTPLPSPLQTQAEMLYEVQVHTPLPSPPQSDDESDDWRYEC